MEVRSTTATAASSTLLRFLVSSLLLAGLVLTLAPGVSRAASLTVTNLNNSGPGSLRQAILDANATAGDDTIAFQDGLAGTITLTSGELTIASSLTIQGPGAEVLTLSGGGDTRVFSIPPSDSSMAVTIDDLTIRDGFTLEGGGAILNHVALTISNSILTNNQAYGYGMAGGILNHGRLDIVGSTLSNNFSLNPGGGIYNSWSSSLHVASSTINGNGTELDGGGIFNDGTLVIANSTISGSFAGGFGGGVFNNFAGVALITNSTFAGNTAAWDGGGVYNFGTATLTNSTFSGNAVGRYGGGYGAGFDIGAGMLAGNVMDENSPTNCTADPDALIADNGHNVSSDGTCVSAGTSLANTDPLLDPAGLQDNGGPTQTIALLPDSPAIDLVPIDANGCGTTLTTDQRGNARPHGPACDSGAVEHEVANVAPLAADDGPYMTLQNQPLIVNAADGLLANDSDADGDPLSAVLVAGPAHGALTPNADGSFSYTPGAGFVGTDSFTYQASDGADGSNVATATIRVSYFFSGFLSPVDDLPMVNRAKAGSAIPVTFSLGGDQGLAILAAGSPNSQRVTCDASAPLDAIEQTVTAGASSLSYDVTTNTYTYVWKTEKSWSGTCRQLMVTLVDGSVHQALFTFTK
jgi:hypothetical protein